jgi:hypothetical protein
VFVESYKKGRRGKAKGRRKEGKRERRVVGLKPTLKKVCDIAKGRR